VDALALQPDGGILLAGQFRPGANDDMLVMRLNPDGSTDPGFGTGGFVGIDFAPRDAAQAIAVAPDGRIVVAGHKGGGNDLAVARLTAEGALAPSFDGDGRMTSGLPGSDSARALAVQPDGRIVVAGVFRPTAFLQHMFVARIGVDGSLDATFADDGTTSVESVKRRTDAAAEAVLLQPDGGIVVAGASGGPSNMTAARLTPDGSVDAGFGAGGRVSLRFGASSSAEAAALAPDGGIVLAGSLQLPGATDTALARLEGGGALVPARCAGQRATLVGTPGRDDLRGTPGRDVVAALGGNDTAAGLDGNDLICLGPGKDRGLGGPGNDRIFGDAGADRVAGGSGADRLQGGAGPDLLSGDDGDDRLLGGPGADLLLGGSGRDRLDGLGGRDEARGGEGSDACRAEVRILC
jgi:uncharacterized delta-60 repeat protein